MFHEADKRINTPYVSKSVKNNLKRLEHDRLFVINTLTEYYHLIKWKMRQM